MDIRIGISGWTYPPWRGGAFYPKGLAQRKELSYVAERLNSVEINGSFYALQRPSSYQRWASLVGEGFIFAVKGGRFITHMKKLSEVETPLANFFASGVLALNQRLGPVLWQLPPHLGYAPERMEAFFRHLPHTTGAAGQLAGRHDQKVPADRAWVKVTNPRQRIRHAIEVRHESFRSAEFYALLQEYEIALVVADNPGQWPIIEEVTADFVYVRLHGHEELYASGYSQDALDTWASKIKAWAGAGRDVYVYCDNDAKVRAPYDAMGLLNRLGLNPRGQAPDEG